MSETQTALKKQDSMTLKQLLAQPAYKERFNQLLGERAPQFMASIINVANSSSFSRVEPTSILSAAAVAATLDLPIDKNLGYAWIVPYGNLAQFQIGYKGWIQLALRSAQYSGMNAFMVNAEALGGYDNIGDPIILWDKLDETKPAVGYVFAWRLINGFAKIVYWPKDKMLAHAQRYSQAYRAKLKSSAWFTDEDKMGLKTVIGNSIKKWGIVSIEMRTAFERDQSAAIDIDARPVYPDNEETEEESSDEDRAAALTQRLAQERESESGNTNPFQATEGTSEAATGDRGALLDSFNNLVEKTTLKIAKDFLETVTGTKIIEKVKDEQVKKTIEALNNRAAQEL